MCTIREREPSSPIFLLGQGAGGLVACLYALTNPRQLNGVICSSIALELPLHPMFRSGIELLAAVAPRIPVLRVRSGSFSRDPGIVARMNDDPLINGERQRARMVSETLRAGDELRKSASELLQPLLVLHGSADTVTLPSGSEYMHEHAGSRDKTLQIFEGYHHDLINEQGHELVVEKICQWIDTQLHATAQRTLIGIEYINAGSSSGSP
jgi:alpha-beta hydrolase superfamily lysophospholipase